MASNICCAKQRRSEFYSMGQLLSEREERGERRRQLERVVAGCDDWLLDVGERAGVAQE